MESITKHNSANQMILVVHPYIEKQNHVNDYSDVSSR